MRVKLKEICTLLNGRAYKQHELLDKGKYPVLRVGNFFSDKEFYYSDLELEENKYCDNGDLLFAWSASFGPKIWDGGKVIFHYHIWKMILTEQVDKEYLFYQLKYLSEKIKQDGHGGIMIHTTKQEMENREILLPSLIEQKEIVKKLSAVGELINKREKQLILLDDLVKSRFVELFGEVGTDTKGWGLKRLSDCCTINPKKGEDKRLHKDLMVSFVPMPAVSEKGEIDASETKSYDEVKTGFTYFAEQDVLFAKITPCMENGKGAVAKGLCNGIGFGSTEFHVLRPIEGVSNSYWLYVVTAFKQFRMDAASNMTGSAGQRRVPASFLDAYKISVPPIELQKQFAAFVEQTDKSKFFVQYC